MKKCLIIFVSMLFVFAFCNNVFADSQNITYYEEVDGNSVHIYGEISNPYGNHEVAILVCNDKDDITGSGIVYLDQVTSNIDGSFDFYFMLPEGTTLSDYEYIVGMDDGNGLTLENDTGIFIDADITVNINSYVPSIKGKIICYNGQTVTINIVNTTDQTVVANDVLTVGEHNLSYQLPNLITSKNYSLSIISSYGTENLATINVDVDSSIILVSIDGAVNLADGVELDVNVQSNNSDFINKSTTISSNKNLSLTIPNVVANASYHLALQGYKTETEDLPEVEQPGYDYVVTGNSGDVVNVVAVGENITSFDKTFTVEYDKDCIKATNLFGTHYENTLLTQTKGNIQIVSFQPGKIQFKRVNEEIPEGGTWSGILNIFKFEFLKNYSGNTVVKIY